MTPDFAKSSVNADGTIAIRFPKISRKHLIA